MYKYKYLKYKKKYLQLKKFQLTRGKIVGKTLFIEYVLYRIYPKIKWY